MQTIRQGIRTDTEVELLLTEGDKLVGDISKLYELQRQANVRLSEFKQNGVRLLKERVDEIEGEVAFEIKDDATLKNADQRRIALNKQLKGNPGWLTAKAVLSTAERTEIKMYQEAFRHEHDIKTARNYFYVWLSRMEVIASLSNEQQEHRHHFTAGLNVTIGGNNGEEKT